MNGAYRGARHRRAVKQDEEDDRIKSTATAVAAAVAEARDEIARTDAKAGTLLTLSTGALAGLLSFVRVGHVPLPAAIALWLASALTTAALALLLMVVRPRLENSRDGIFPDHEVLLVGTGVDGWQAERLRLFSALAVAKHRKVRRAVDLLFIALAMLAAAALVTAT